MDKRADMINKQYGAQNALRPRKPYWLAVLLEMIFFGWQLRLDLLVEMFKRFCYMSKLWDFESQLYQCILYADFE